MIPEDIEVRGKLSQDESCWISEIPLLGLYFEARSRRDALLKTKIAIEDAVGIEDFRIWLEVLGSNTFKVGANNKILLSQFILQRGLRSKISGQLLKHVDEPLVTGFVLELEHGIEIRIPLLKFSRVFLQPVDIDIELPKLIAKIIGPSIKVRVAPLIRRHFILTTDDPKGLVELIEKLHAE